MKGSTSGVMSENMKQKEWIESERDVGEPETKRRGRIWAQNPKQNKGIESGHDAGEPEKKQRDRIRTRCRRTRNKTKGSNSGTMPEKPKQNEGIKSGHDA